MSQPLQVQAFYSKSSIILYTLNIRSVTFCFVVDLLSWTPFLTKILQVSFVYVETLI